MKKETAAERVARDMQTELLSGKWHVGDKYLCEHALCEQYGVSRTTVREAMRLLQAMGMITLQAGRGAFVAAITETDMRQNAAQAIFDGEEDYLELTELRIALEPAIASLAALRASEQEQWMLLGLLQVYEKAYEAADPLGMADANKKFHLALAQATHNRVYEKLYRQLSDACDEYVCKLFAVEENGKAAMAEHRAVADAILTRDDALAHAAMQAHTENIRDNIRNIHRKVS